MARPSKVDRLPDEIRDAIGDLRRQGKTIDEILRHLRGLGVADDAVSRTGLGRAVKKWDELAARLNKSRAAAEAIMSRIEDGEADDRIARLNVAALHASILELMGGEDGEPVQLDPKEAMQLSTALKNLTQAARADQSRYREMQALLDEERARAERVKAAMEQASRGGGGKADAQAALQVIREAYGIA